MTGTVVCFGEMLLRYAPQADGGLRGSAAFAVHVGGAEANVAISLACLGQPARMATVLPEGPLGDRAIDHLARHGVRVDACVRRPGRMGAYFIESPRAGRDGIFFYDRAGSALARADDRAIDWDAALDGAPWLHLSGISAALGDGVVAMMRRAVDAAHRRAVPVSFDCNYRPALWQGREPQAHALLGAFARSARLLFATPWDVAMLLRGDGSPDPADPARLFAAFPQLAMIAATQRSQATDGPGLAASLAVRGDEPIAVPAAAITPYVERVGAGDAFVAALLFALTAQRAPRDALRFAHRACIMKHAIPGDHSDLPASAIDRWL